MKSNIHVVLAAVLLLGPGLALAADSKVMLTGKEEVPAVQTEATGSGTITVGADNTVSGSVTTKGVEGIAAHIHVAPPGKNGPPIVTLEKGADGMWSVPKGSKLTAEQLASYKAGELYVNVHSAAHKGGEIRGQLKP
jgi:CHRD domain